MFRWDKKVAKNLVAKIKAEDPPYLFCDLKKGKVTRANRENCFGQTIFSICVNAPIDCKLELFDYTIYINPILSRHFYQYINFPPFVRKKIHW